MSIGERILIALEKSNKTQADLARFLSTKSSTITGWIKEGRIPSAASVLPICEFTGVSVIWLLAGDEEAGGCEGVGSAGGGLPEARRGGVQPPETEKDTITIEQKDGSRYILPATPESYDFLKQLRGSNGQQISPEDQALLKMLKDLTPEEKRDMYSFLSEKESTSKGA